MTLPRRGHWAMSEDTCGHHDWGYTASNGQGPGGCSIAPRTAPHGGCWAPKVTSAEAETVASSSSQTFDTQTRLLGLCGKRGCDLRTVPGNRGSSSHPSWQSFGAPQGTLGDVSTFMVVVTGEVFPGLGGDGAWCCSVPTGPRTAPFPRVTQPCGPR